MGKIYAFLLGVVAGFGLYHLAGSYHVLRAESGWRVVPKVSHTLEDTYVDVRDFGAGDWAKRPELAAAVLKSGDDELKKDAVSESVNQLLPGRGSE